MPYGYESEKIEHPNGTTEYRCKACQKSFGSLHPMFHTCEPASQAVKAAVRKVVWEKRRCEGPGFCEDLDCYECSTL